MSVLRHACPRGPTRSSTSLSETQRGTLTPVRSISLRATLRKCAGAQGIVEDDENEGHNAVVVQGLLGRVVAQVGRETSRHGGGIHGPPLPLQEEGVGPFPGLRHTEPVGMNGAKPPSVPEVAGGVMGRADLQDPEAGVPLGLSGQRRHEVVYPLGVLDGAGQGTAARPGTLRQPEEACPSAGSTFHRRMALDTEARSLRAGSANPRRLRASRRRPLRCTRETRPSRPRRDVSLDTPEGESSKRPLRWSAVIQGHSDSRSNSRLSAGLRTTGSR